MIMDNSVYKIVEVVGFSETSWEDAAKVAVSTVDRSIRDMRVAEVVKMDMRLEDNRIVGYRTKLKVSFKLE
jgi:flavin-binding protein dodecin